MIYCSSDIGVISTDDLSREGTALVTLKDVKAHDASLPGINLKNNVLEQSSIDCLSNELKRKHLLESLGNLKIDSATILKLETKEIRGRYTTFLEVSYQIQDPQKNKTTFFFRTNGYGRKCFIRKSEELLFVPRKSVQGKRVRSCCLFKGVQFDQRRKFIKVTKK